PKDRYATAAELQRAIDQLAVSLGAATSEEDVATFVKQTIGETMTKRAQDLKAAIAAVDGADAPRSTETGKRQPAPAAHDAAAPARSKMETLDKDSKAGAAKDGAKAEAGAFDAGGPSAFDAPADADGEGDAKRSAANEIPPPAPTDDAAPVEVSPGAAA